MPYAIIRTGGKQYRVREGDRLRVEKLDVEAGQPVAFDDVLAIGEGDQLTVAQGKLAAQVQAKVLCHGRGRKIHIWKYKCRKGSSRKMGHRQGYTEVQITSIPAAAN